MFQGDTSSKGGVVMTSVRLSSLQISSPKTAYVIHLRNLQFYLSQGVVLTNVRRVIRFRQEAWMAPYITENTRLRQAAVDKFEKDYYKLLNNALFGKTMENVRKRVKIVLVNKGRSHAWQTSKTPTFKRFEIFDENLVGVEVAQTTITLDKPHLCWASLSLELSKLLMFKFHYEVMKTELSGSSPSVSRIRIHSCITLNVQTCTVSTWSD